MKTSKLILGLSALSSIFLFSCKKQQGTPGISYQVKTSSMSAPVNGRLMGGSVQWSSGYAWAEEIEFEAENNKVAVEYKAEPNQKINLFSPLANLGSISVPAGTYENIDFQVEVRPNGPEAALQLNGSFTNGTGVSTPVVFTLNSNLEIEAEQANITIADGSSLTALSTLNLSLLTTDVTETMLNNATRTNGAIEISATSNVDIYNIILKNLKSCDGVEVN